MLKKGGTPTSEETGTWSAHINVAAKQHQDAYDGYVSYPIELQEEVVPVYRTQKQSQEPNEFCPGLPSEPEATAGFLCVYRGGENAGTLEAEDTNAKFFNFQTPGGEYENGGVEGEGEAKTAKVGELIQFRTSEFALTPIKEIAKPAYLSAGGSWAVRQK